MINQNPNSQGSQTQRRLIEQAIFGLGLGIAVAAFGPPLAGDALASAQAGGGEHAFSGTITRVSPDSIELKTGCDTLRFSRSTDIKEDVHVGDHVIVYADLAAKRIRKDIRPKQEPGEKGKEIKDDRAFYSASREESGP
jgi:hypothetical protein